MNKTKLYSSSCAVCTVATHAQITFVLSNLMLTGLATPFLHNGIITAEAPEEGSEDFQVNSESFHSQWKYRCRGA